MLVWALTSPTPEAAIVLPRAMMRGVERMECSSQYLIGTSSEVIGA
jgi:hypothetical protein